MTKEKAKIPDIYPASKSLSNAALQASLRLLGIENLQAPRPDSYYLNWEFFLDQFLQETKVAYFIT